MSSPTVTNRRVVLKRGNDQVVTLTGLKAVQTDQFLNGATVVATLFNGSGKNIPAFTKVPMSYVADSDGDYQWVIESATMMLPAGIEYTLEVRAVEDSLNYRVVMPVSIVDGLPTSVLNTP